VIFFKRPPLTVTLPVILNADTMFTFVEGVIDEHQEAMAERITLDFANLDFIEPVGVVILSNLIEYLRRQGARIQFQGNTKPTVAIKFLADSQFFDRYDANNPFPDARVRPTTIPLNQIRKERSQQFLNNELMPWIEKAVGLSERSLSGVKTSIEEILHNVSDHSGVDYGCTFAQHFPQKARIQVAVSDFGIGIPDLVRTKVPEASDTHALRLACQEGFTTKSNVQNRGAGLPNLMRYVTQRNGGNVLLVSGQGALTASPSFRTGATHMTPKRARGRYPGTLVRVILRTDTLERAAEDAELEPFEW
jgi:anti-sigma regulatory factor (Ser/Thr protein kinase)/anti-anti-sigma regulatory factor